MGHPEAQEIAISMEIARIKGKYGVNGKLCDNRSSVEKRETESWLVREIERVRFNAASRDLFPHLNIHCLERGEKPTLGATL